ncbi:hypothetical protein ACEWY4_008941 [Coilia grayii]|uniref:C-type lectin domain-containing protein n=1 Tax=Coilia grayii TaxID=363190 RepID=A0ABD1K515_9TELE
MQASETDILQFPAIRTPETRLRRKCLLVLSFIGAVLLAVTLTAVIIHYTYRRGERNHPKAPPVPKMRSEQEERWLLFDNDFYLFWQSDGADCDTAKEFCANKNANLTMIDQNNVHWILKRAKGKRLWILTELEGSGSNDNQTSEPGDVGCALHPPGPKSGRANGWICRRGS